MKSASGILIALELILALSFSDGKLRQKRQTFQSSSYTFCPTVLVPGTVVGQVNTTAGYNAGVTFRVLNSNSTVAIDLNNGRLILINTFPANTCMTIPTTATLTSGTVLNVNVVISTVSGCSTSSTATSCTAGGLPVFGSSSYSLTTSGCSLNTLLGTITATSSTGLSTTYAIANVGSLATSYLYIAPTTGQLYLSGTPTSLTSVFYVVATNSAGSTSVPVTLTLGCTSTTTSATTTTSSVVKFGQTIYSFTDAVGDGGSIVGQVFATSPNTPVTYSTTSTLFTVNSANGLINVGANPLPAGLYTITVTATDAAGKTTTSTVYITVTANGSQTASTAATTTGTTTPFIPTGADLG